LAAPLLAPPAAAAPRRARGAPPPAAAALLPCLLSLLAASAAALAAPGAARAGAPLPPALCGAAARPAWAVTAGAALGWLSAACYASSRLSQLSRNRARRSAVGLSPAMFALAIAGNALYAASVALRLRAWRDAARAAPWLAGSLGVLCLDAVLVAQACAAAAGAAAEEAEAAAGEAEDGAARGAEACEGDGEGYAPPPLVAPPGS
jgi:hypothetical protein